MTSLASGELRTPKYRLPRQTQVRLIAVGTITAPIACGAALSHPGLIRLALLVALVPAVLGTGLLAPTGLLYALAIWLMLMGLLRRLVGTVAQVGNASLGDPLLLVEPMIILILVAVAVQKGALRNRTLLANAVLGLTLLTLVGAVNPLQGGLAVGIAGMLFLLVPLLAFWVGRTLVDEWNLRRLLLLIAGLGVPATLYGLFQQDIGMPSWDRTWLVVHGYSALNVGGVNRAFGTFSASAEYECFLAIGVIICAANVRRRTLIPISLSVGALLAYGVFYDASRGTVVLGAGALGLMWSARRRLPPVSALLGGIGGIAVLLLVAGHFASQSHAVAKDNSALIQHQVQGLANPLSTKDSTLVGHFSEMTTGLKSTFTNPIGNGTGTVTIAASRFGATSQSTEVDPSNLGVAFGVPGLVSYVLIAIAGLSTVYRLASRTRDWWALAVLGILIVTFLQWSNGGQYAVAWLPWLVLGWADRAWVNLDTPKTGQLLAGDAPRCAP